MNNQRRKEITKAYRILEDIKAQWEEAASLIEGAADGEQEYYDNMPDGLKEGEKGTQAEQVACDLTEIKDAMSEIDLDDWLSKLDDAGQ